MLHLPWPGRHASCRSKEKRVSCGDATRHTNTNTSTGRGQRSDLTHRLCSPAPSVVVVVVFWNKYVVLLLRF